MGFKNIQSDKTGNYWIEGCGLFEINLQPSGLDSIIRIPTGSVIITDGPFRAECRIPVTEV